MAPFNLASDIHRPKSVVRSTYREVSRWDRIFLCGNRRYAVYVVN